MRKCKKGQLEVEINRRKKIFVPIFPNKNSVEPIHRLTVLPGRNREVLPQLADGGPPIPNRLAIASAAIADVPAHQRIRTGHVPTEQLRPATHSRAGPEGTRRSGFGAHQTTEDFGYAVVHQRGAYRAEGGRRGGLGEWGHGGGAWRGRHVGYGEGGVCG